MVDVGGSNVKLYRAADGERIKIPSPGLAPADLLARVRAEAADYDVVSLGFPAPVRDGKLVVDPVNLGPGWVGFDFEAAFERPVRVLNDAAMQALGAYQGGRMLFLSLGTGLGSCLVVAGELVPMELGHLPYKGEGSFEDFVGKRGKKRLGKESWTREVHRVLRILRDAIQPDEIALGGGETKKLLEPPPNTRLVSSAAAALAGGLKLWEDAEHGPGPRPSPSTTFVGRRRDEAGR